MDVTCDRCKTRYEFDAALVSSRGTTVKCTNCSHQFRVFRPAGSGGLSGWTVRKADGSELRYLAMRELQSAISTRHVSESDLLVADDGSPPQQLGAIEELRSFFQSADPVEADTTRRRKLEQTAKDRAPLPPPQSARAAPPPLPDDIDTLETSQALPRVDVGSFQRARLGGTSLGFSPPIAAPPAPRPQSAPPASERTPDPIFQGTNLDDDVKDALDRVSLAIRESSPPQDDDSGIPSKAPAESDAPRASSPGEEEGRASSYPAAGRPSVLRRSSTGDPRFSEYGRRSSRPGFGRWAAGLVAIGIVGVVGVTALRKLGGESKGTAVPSVENERVTKLLQDGEKLLLDGDIDGAKEQFAKANGAGENDPRTAKALARVALVQSDILWLRGKLESKDPENLAKSVERAAAAVTAVAKYGGDDPTSAYLEVDALRLQGKLADARKLVSKLNAREPNAGRALATLDLCEANPGWDTVLDRLRTAVGVEKKLGQAQGLLVYALARHGDVEAAKREVEKLAELAPAYPLLAAMREFVGKAKPTSSADAAASANADGAEPGADFRETLKRARTAQKQAKYEDAERLYKTVLEKNPGNSEALGGLAEVARARGDSAGAEKRYKEMLKENPNFVPGLAGLADMKWQRGDKGGAMELYRQVILNAPGTPYADHAHARIQEATGNAAPAMPKAASKAPGKRETKREPTSAPSNPEIDTTDLPP
jgi:predicted Zn finger-like uncharacterized protein